MQKETPSAPRPVSSGRPRTFDPQKATEKAALLFWQKGYDTTSMTDLLHAMGIGKGSFYLTYPGGKKELFEKVLHQQGSQLLHNLTLEISSGSDPIEGIKNFFRSIASVDSENWFNGCFISNTLVEQSHQDTSLRDQATVWFKKIEKEFISALKKAKKKRLLKTKEKPRVLARYLISAWNGLQVSRRILSQKKDLEKIIELHLSVLH